MYDYRGVDAAGNKGFLLALVEDAMPIREGRFAPGLHHQRTGKANMNVLGLLK